LFLRRLRACQARLGRLGNQNHLGTTNLHPDMTHLEDNAMAKRPDPNKRRKNHEDMKTLRSIDSTVTLLVTSTLRQDPRIKDAAIDVSSTAGVVTLSGTVASQDIRQAAETIARRQRGVTLVINDLRLAQPDEEQAASPEEVATHVTART
jgi:hypothetical protein